MSSQIQQASDSFKRKGDSSQKPEEGKSAETKSPDTTKANEGSSEPVKSHSEEKTASKRKESSSQKQKTRRSERTSSRSGGSRGRRRSSQEPQAPSVAVADSETRGKGVIRSIGAFGFSTGAHVVMLVALGMILVKDIQRTAAPEVVVANVVEEVPDEEELKIELEEDLKEVTELTSDPITSASVSGLAGSAPTRAEQPTMDRQLVDNLNPVPVNVASPASAVPSTTSMIREVPAGSFGESRAIVDDYQQAMDRITQEILWALDRSDVLVVWVFDQSESMKDDQREIRQRINKVYTELGLTEKSQGEHLLTAVTSYGRGFIQHTRRPTADLDLVREAIDKVPIDPSGKEMMTQAIGTSIAKHRQYARRGRRQMMVVVVSDESGDQQSNHKYLENAIAEAKSADCRCYFLGRESVFGYPYVHISWKHPQTNHTHWLPVDRGPETAFIEQLQTNGFRRRYDAFPSGFGPYEQTRIARETGGIFFMLPSLESKLVRGEKRKYELEAMQSYKPDLRSRLEVVQDRTKLRALIWKVVNDLNPYNEQVQKVIELRHSFSPKPDVFLKQVAQEQTKAKLYLNYLAAAQKAMEDGVELRNQETSPRWRANYDLIYAQIVAYQARVYEYGAYLEYFKKNPKVVPFRKTVNKKVKTLNHWHIHTQRPTLTGEISEPYIKKSSELFQEVMSKHPGTPWAARAQWELRRGFGVGLHEVYWGPRPKLGAWGSTYSHPQSLTDNLLESRCECGKSVFA